MNPDPLPATARGAVSGGGCDPPRLKKTASGSSGSRVSPEGYAGAGCSGALALM